MSGWLEQHPASLYVVGALLVPLTFLGFGTDVDVANVRSSGASIREGHYSFSRTPGSLPHEAATAVLDRVGGSVATNLASLAVAVAVLALLASLLRRAGSSHATLAAITLAASPFFLIAATSLEDHLWAIGFLLGGIELEQRRRPVLAGVLMGLAIGTRVAMVVLVLAFVFAVGRRAIKPGVVAALAGAACFIPSWLSVGRSREFLRNQFEFSGWANTAGRWLVKNELFLGIPAWLVLIVGTPVIVAAVARWRASPLVRFAVLGGLGMEAVFLRLPWKLAHLLPVLVCLVIVVALSPKVTARYLLVLAAAQLVWGLVAVRIVVPDIPDAATGANFDPALVAGPLVTDVRCRVDESAPPSAEDDFPDAYEHSLAMWACTNDWWGGGSDTVPTTAVP